MKTLGKVFLVASIALSAVAFARPAAAERIVTSLPHAESFDANNYSELLWTTEGATHTWLPTGGWKGGAAKFTPCITNEGYSGLGQFVFRGIDPMPPQLNVRFLIYHGSTWREYGPGDKLIIMNREGNRGRPMIITREFEGPNGTWETWGACDGTVCRYEEGDYWPLGGDRLRIGDAPIAREEQWISVEFEANVVTGMIRLYVDTLDGELHGLYVERAMDDTGTGGTWSYIDIIGGYMAAAVRADPNNYFLIDELAIASSKIGPPAGFGTTPPEGPSAPDAGGPSSTSGGTTSPGSSSNSGPPAAPGAESPPPSAPVEEGCNAAGGQANGIASVLVLGVVAAALRRAKRRS